MKNIYTIEKISQRSYTINENYGSDHTTRMGLVVGENSAALIDTGTGAGDLATIIKQVTDLPVRVYNTHWHMDHTGANGQFSTCHISYIDAKNWKIMQGQTKICLNTKTERRQYIRDVTQHDPMQMNMLLGSLRDDFPFTPVFIDEEERIDLGGISLRPIYLPGHTAGSMVFVNEEERIIFAGDAILMRVWLHTDPATTVEGYCKALQRYLDLTVGIKNIIPAHQYGVYTRDDVAELYLCAQEIMHGAQGLPFTRHGIQGLIHQRGSKYIVFSKERIYQQTEYK